MKIFRGRLVAMALFALLGAAAAGAGTLAYEVRAAVVVLDAGRAGAELTRWAEEAGGYFVERSEQSVLLRIPAERIGDLRSVLERVAEVILAYEPAARDVREELDAVEAGITSREEALGLILSYVEEADVAGTLALEQEIAAIVNDLDTLQGRLRRLTNDGAYARVEVALSSRRQTVPAQRPSSFAWINTVDLYRFLREVLPYAR